MADGPKLTIAGKIFVVLFFAGCAYGAYRLLNLGGGPSKEQPDKPPIAQGGGNDVAPVKSNATNSSDGAVVELGMAYGTEKKTWLEWAVREFSQTPAGQHIQVKLIPLGSLDAAQAITRDKDKRIHVWCPASSLYKDVFLENWQVEAGAGSTPIAKEENLAFTPMVFVMWDERYQAFIKKYGSLSFTTIGQALQEKEGWNSIAMQPDWGLFKFGHTHPNKSNSGLMALVMMAYDYRKKTAGLTQKDVLDADFQDWMVGIEHNTAGLLESTGTMMTDMVLRGPSQYDALLVYESVVIDRLKSAEGRWGGLHVVYPKWNMWNENPYYILDVPWSDAAHRKAAEAFLEFLMSEPAQRAALTHGFRPGNPDVRIKDQPDSPFTLFEKSGLRIELNTVCESPKAAVVNTLIEIWEKRASR